MIEETTHLTCTETAKLIRKALKQEFPGQKFSVRSRTYAGGASIDAEWTDGPTTSEVETVTNRFEAKGFDSMIDLSYYKDHWLLPDGSVVLAHSQGSGNSGGVDSEIKNDKPHPEAVRVSFGADYIPTSRNFSAEALETIADQVVTELSKSSNVIIPEFTIETSKYSGAHIQTDDRQPVIPGGPDNIQDLVMAEARKTSLFPLHKRPANSQPQPEPEPEVVTPVEEVPQVTEPPQAQPTNGATPQPQTDVLENLARHLLTDNSAGDVLNILVNSGLGIADATWLLYRIVK